MKKLTVIMTCFNRKEYTLRCINSLNETAGLLADWRFNYVVVDDNSTDGTEDALVELSAAARTDICVLKGNGNLFYTGGMRKGIEYAKVHCADSDGYLLANDDVRFDSASVSHMIADMDAAVLVGATKDDDGRFSYGGIRYVKGIKYIPVKPEDDDRTCDTFNANCVLVPGDIFRASPNMDEAYNHSLGDFDYGLQIKRLGYRAEVYRIYAGVCNKNDVRGTWNDTTLPRKLRLAKKEGIKGLPRREWYHFLRKNFGVATAFTRSLTPYIRILLGR